MLVFLALRIHFQLLHLLLSSATAAECSVGGSLHHLPATHLHPPPPPHTRQRVLLLPRLGGHVSVASHPLLWTSGGRGGWRTRKRGEGEELLQFIGGEGGRCASCEGGRSASCEGGVCGEVRG